MNITMANMNPHWDLRFGDGLPDRSGTEMALALAAECLAFLADEWQVMIDVLLDLVKDLQQ